MTDERVTKHELRERLNKAYDEINSAHAEVAALRDVVEKDRHFGAKCFEREQEARRALAHARALLAALRHFRPNVKVYLNEEYLDRVRAFLDRGEEKP